MPPSPEEVVEGWRKSAQHWEKHGATLRQMFAPITRAMIEVSGIAEGEHVLDIAGGVGEPAFSIADLVGPRGSVVYTDVAEEMVAAARREARRQDLSNVTFRCCPADSIPFEDGRFDHTVCRLGAMFFPDVGAALREMLRVTKPRGRWTGVVWSGPASNPMFTVVTEALDRYVPGPPEPPDAPGAFRFAEPGRLAALLRQAGALEVAEQVVRFSLEAPLSFEEFWAMRSEISDSLRAKLCQLLPDRSKALVTDIREAARQYFPDGSMCLPAEVILVTGVRAARA